MKCRMRNGKLVSVVPATGSEGFLLRPYIHEIGTFRIYDEKNKRIFTDHRIYHSDLELKITGEAYFYYDDEGNAWLDHSPEVLGLVIEEINNEDS